MPWLRATIVCLLTLGAADAALAQAQQGLPAYAPQHAPEVAQPWQPQYPVTPATAEVELAPRELNSLPKLSPPGASPSPGNRGGAGSVFTIIASLAMVLGLFLGSVWIMRRSMPAGIRPLPGEVVELLGRCPLPGRQQAHLLRCGNKLVLVAFSSAGADTITEITDPLEVDRLAGLCRQALPTSATTAFRQMFDQFSGERRADRDEHGRHPLSEEERHA